MASVSAQRGRAVASAGVIEYGRRGEFVEVLGIAAGQSVVEHGHPRGCHRHIGCLGIVDLGALGRSPHRHGYPMTPAERSRAIVLAL